MVASAPMSAADVVVVAPDAFKGCLSAPEVSRAMATGINQAWPRATVRLVPVADGGEGSLELVLRSAGGTALRAEVTGPLGRPTVAQVGLLADGQQAWIESAQACGLPLVAATERDPMRTSTYGVGQLVLEALGSGRRRLVLGLGGSATVDGGSGLLQAMGARLLDGRGRAVPTGGLGLSRVERLDLDGLDPRLATAELIGAVDVRNPLLGPMGAARVFGPQKGADAGQVAQLEAGLVKWADLLFEATGRSVHNLAGAGAAGGMGAAWAALGAELRSGAELVCDWVELDRAMVGARLVITGEGRTDGQTWFGKAPAEVARRARQAGLPVGLIAGALGSGAQDLRRLGYRWILDLADLGGLPAHVRMRPQVAAGLLAEAAHRMVARVESDEADP